MSTFEQWLARQNFGQVRSRKSLTGGDISETQHLVTSSGLALCVKQREGAPADFFAAERHGLEALADTLKAAKAMLSVPACLGHGPTFIAMEYIAPAPRRTDYWQTLGRALALMHQQPAPCFGFSRHNYCGLTPQMNTREKDGHQFFARFRLEYQAQLALLHKRISDDDAQLIARLCERLPILIPTQPASLIHGDLWSGNVLVNSEGGPTLIDPACHYGWAEAELAMTQLFGGFPQEFYSAYTETRPLEPGWKERLALYNIYHLLNHLNLFGRSYHAQVMDSVRCYL